MDSDKRSRVHVEALFTLRDAVRIMRLRWCTLIGGAVLGLVVAMFVIWPATQIYAWSFRFATNRAEAVGTQSDVKPLLGRVRLTRFLAQRILYHLQSETNVKQALLAILDNRNPGIEPIDALTMQLYERGVDINGANLKPTISLAVEENENESAIVVMVKGLKKSDAVVIASATVLALGDAIDVYDAMPAVTQEVLQTVVKSEAEAPRKAAEDSSSNWANVWERDQNSLRIRCLELFGRVGIRVDPSSVCPGPDISIANAADLIWEPVPAPRIAIDALGSALASGSIDSEAINRFLSELAELSIARLKHALTYAVKIDQLRQVQQNETTREVIRPLYFVRARVKDGRPILIDVSAESKDLMVILVNIILLSMMSAFAAVAIAHSAASHL